MSNVAAIKKFPLLKHADALVENLRRVLPRAVKQWEESSIHDARVCTRRLKAILDVLSPVLSKEHRKPFAKILGKLRRQLGPLRDADVMLGHVDSVSSKQSRKGSAWIVERLKERREGSRRGATKKIDPPKVLAKLGAWWGVREELDEAQPAVDSLLAESLHLQLDAFVERADAMVNNRPADLEDASADDPHELRIAGKALRYTLEMAIVEGHRLPASVTRAFKRMQDALGLWHDYVVLAECVSKISVEEKLFYHDAEMAGQVIELARTALKKSSKELQRFSMLWRGKGEELTDTIRHAFPLTRAMPTTLLKMDRDLSDSTENPTPEDPAPAEPSTSPA